MTTHRLARFSQRMALFTLLLIVAMLGLNTALWVYPVLGSGPGGLGMAFGLSAQMMNGHSEIIARFTWWQTLGAILLTSVPLLMLASGLNHLRGLFKSYAAGEYFSSAAAVRLGKVGRAVALWVALNFVCGPMLSVWSSLLEPDGQRFVTITFTSSDLVALFLAACIAVIARILWQASELASENRTFV